MIKALVALGMTLALAMGSAIGNAATPPPPGHGFDIRPCYALEVAHFLNVLTGRSFFTDHYPNEYKEWKTRLNPASMAIMRELTQGLNGVAPSQAIQAMVSVSPGSEEGNLLDLLRNADKVLGDLYDSGMVGEGYPPKEMALRLVQALSVVVADLEAKGFKAYWTRNMLPRVEKAIADYGRYLEGAGIDMDKELLKAMGPGVWNANKPIRFYMLGYSQPYGGKLYDHAFYNSMQCDHKFTTKVAAHEMLHQLPNQSNFGPGFTRLLEDPFYMALYAEYSKRPDRSYHTAREFLEENVVEALETALTTKAGIEGEPLRYLAIWHDGGSHRLSVVLIGYLLHTEQHPGESLADYLTRVVDSMPMGSLDKVYAERMASLGI